jgi:lipopolysaccharide export system permease protein
LIIFRYLCREILSVTFAVCFVLLLILVSGRFVQYLGNVVDGSLDVEVIFTVIAYRMPGILELTLPLAFFVAVMLSFGRMYIDNEMSVLKACGISENKLLGYTLIIAAFLAVTVGWLSLSVSPSGMAKSELILVAQKQKTVLDKLLPNKFYSLGSGKGITYVEDVAETQTLDNVFLALTKGSQTTNDSRLVLIRAESGVQHKSADQSESFLVLDQGYRVEGVPGTHQYQITHFKEFGSRMESRAPIIGDAKSSAIVTSELLASDDPKLQAALQWRLSLPLMVFVAALLAIPLSRTNPRQGRFDRLLPAILLYFIYMVALNALRGSLESGAVPITVTLLPVHLLFLSIGLALLRTGRPKKVASSALGAQS